MSLQSADRSVVSAGSPRFRQCPECSPRHPLNDQCRKAETAHDNDRELVRHVRFPEVHIERSNDLRREATPSQERRIPGSRARKRRIRATASTSAISEG